MKTFIISILSFLSLAANATPEEQFWKWFQKNDASLFNFEKDQEKAFDQLAAQIQKVNPNLTFEFGPKVNNKREFIISADGIKDAFPKVESLYSAAPSNLSKWIIVKFRPRREPFDIQYSGITVKAESVQAILQKQGDKIAITLVIPDFTEENRKTYTGIAYLILDQALGEYDVETKVGYIDIRSSVPASIKSVPLDKLPVAFDLALK